MYTNDFAAHGYPRLAAHQAVELVPPLASTAINTVPRGAIITVPHGAMITVPRGRAVRALARVPERLHLALHDQTRYDRPGMTLCI